MRKWLWLEQEVMISQCSVRGRSQVGGLGLGRPWRHLVSMS